MSSLYAYGSSYSTTFEPVDYFLKPQVILRLVSVLFAIIVFSCISAGGFEQGVCLYAGTLDACNYGIVIGVLAFLICLVFLGVDAKFSSLSNVKTRKTIVMVDIGVSGFWAFMWFVGFCFLTNKWVWTDTDKLNNADTFVPYWKRSNCRAAIAFTFFSIFTWGSICGLAVRNYLMGEENVFTSNREVEAQARAAAAAADQSGGNQFTYPGTGAAVSGQPAPGGRSDLYAMPYNQTGNNSGFGNMRY